MSKKNPIWNSRILIVKDRLAEPVNWFPFPVLIASALVLYLTAHILSGSNPRAGHPANIITLPAKTGNDSALWLSVSPIDDQIVVTTADRKVFRWSTENPKMSDVQPLVDDLKRTITNEIESAVLAKKALKSQTVAIIAADQRLTFLHMRPIISALAQAGISRYAFETLNPSKVMR